MKLTSWFILVALWMAHATCGWGADDSQANLLNHPNQYWSPTVKQPVPGDQFREPWPWGINTVSGDWFGLRQSLGEHGIAFGIRYVSVMMANTSGGLDTGFFGGGPGGITITVDTENLIGHRGGTLFLDWEYYSWYNHSYPPDSQFDPTGSYVGVNTNLIDGSDLLLDQVAQLFFQQSMVHDSVTLTFGKMDANVIFSSVTAAGAFQNSIAMFTSTLNPFIPTYQNEAVGLVASVQFCDSLTGNFGWFDGTTAAYDASTGISGPATGPRGLSSFFDNGGNWFLVTQWDLSWQADPTRPGSIGIGGWLQTGLTGTAGTNTAGVNNVPGWYLQGQQILWAPSESVASEGGGVALFGQIGWSDPNKNAVHWSLMTGVSATGMLACRPADAVGLMAAHSRFTDNPGIYQSQQADGLSGPAGGSETSIEAFYLAQFSSWYLQPGVMWIATPGGGNPAPLDDAFLPYLLVGADF
ncbi:MAG: carbohydrate porin [Planctomycetales bacterium]